MFRVLSPKGTQKKTIEQRYEKNLLTSSLIKDDKLEQTEITVVKNNFYGFSKNRNKKVIR